MTFVFVTVVSLLPFRANGFTPESSAMVTFFVSAIWFAGLLHEGFHLRPNPDN